MTTKSYSGGFFYDSASNSVLLHLRDGNTKLGPHKWSFLGGGGEEGETPIACFIREIDEEIAIRLSENEIIPLTDYVNEKLQTHRYVFYVEKFVSPLDIHLTEGAGFGWISLDKVFQYDLTDKARADLELFVEKLNKGGK